MGKNMYIETPEKLYELFTAYKEEIKKNPILVHDFVGKDGYSVHREKQRPLTMAGFEVYVMNDEGIASKGVDQYFGNQNDLYGEYVGICSRIRKEIRQDQIEGGSVGIYNASITQRLNGLTDKQEVKTDKVTEMNITVHRKKKTKTDKK